MILMNDLQVAACRARGDAMLHQTAVLVIMIMMRCGGGGVCCGENLLMCCGSRKGGQRARRPERERNWVGKSSDFTNPFVCGPAGGKVKKMSVVV
jgi:hypothetical protein